jgi:alkylhydroperoxidase family enzyme
MTKPRITIPEVPTDALPPQWQAAEKSGALVNIFRIMLRSPKIATVVVELGAAQFGSGSLPPADRELSILTTAACTNSAYEASQHEQISQTVGVTSSQRASVAVGQWDSPELSESQQALVAFVAAVVARPTVPDEVFDAVQRHYSDQQVVETVILTGYYFMLARLSTVFEVPQDPQSGDTVLRAGISLNADK